MAHIGDMHPDFMVAIFKFAIRNCIVKVFGICWVNGEGQYLSEIFSSLNFFRRNLLRNGIGFSICFFVVFERKSKFRHDGVYFYLMKPCFAKYSNDFSSRVFVIVPPFGQFDDYLLIVLGTHQFSTVHKDVLVHFFEVGYYKGKARGNFYTTHKFIPVALHDFQNSTLGSSGLSFHRKYHHAHLVAIQGLLEVGILH